MHIIHLGIILFSFLFLPIFVSGQNVTIHHTQLQFLFDDSLITQWNYHSALKPVEIPWSMYDSIIQLKKKIGTKSFRITPISNAIVGYQKQNNELVYQFGQGVYSSGMLGKKAGYEFNATIYEEKFSSTHLRSIDSLNLIPRHNAPLWNSGVNTSYLSVRGFVYWKPIKWLTLKAGNDKHFIGDGARSFMFSENAAATPFIQTRINVWRINYIHQLMFMRDVLPDSGSNRYSKYASMHTLSFNATKRLNFYIFEAVVWRKQDSVRHRGFDVMYLNPFLFYRPIEFNIGSPDNVLMGIGGKWLTGKKTFVYGQIVIDEFRFQEIKANNGWWANKYAMQIGFKTYSIFKNRKSYLLAEFNNCRPFTYSHSYPLQNYGYLNNALAHPQGSNFRELVSQLGISFNNLWFLNTSVRYLQYGVDPLKKNYGSNIYKPQWSFSKNYGNTIAQGIRNDDFHLEVNLSRLIKPSWRLRIFTTIQTSLHYSQGKSVFLPSFSMGLNTWLYE